MAAGNILWGRVNNPSKCRVPFLSKTTGQSSSPRGKGTWSTLQAYLHKQLSSHGLVRQDMVCLPLLACAFLVCSHCDFFSSSELHFPSTHERFHSDHYCYPVRRSSTLWEVCRPCLQSRHGNRSPSSTPCPSVLSIRRHGHIPRSQTRSQ